MGGVIMHQSVMRFVEQVVADLDLASKDVLEVGSLNVNGSVRRFFSGGSYVGVDMREGPDVDLVLNAHALYPHFASESFDVVVSTEMLEHDDAPWISVLHMRDVIRSGGVLILTARGYDERGCFPLHSYPDDLWRFSVEGVRVMLERARWNVVRAEQDPEAPGVFAVATAE
jgi:SAM-dependent methyltransferase